MAKSLTEEAAGAELRLGRSERAVLKRLAVRDAWAAPALIVLGLVTSFAESLGISLVVLFVYTAIGQEAGGPPVQGFLADIFAAAQTLFGEDRGVAAALVAVILARAAVSTAYRMVSAAAQGRLTQRVRDAVHRQYLDVDYAFLKRHEQGDLLNIIANASWAVASAFLSLTRIAINLCSILVFATFMAMLSLPLFVAAAAGSLVMLGVMRLLKQPARRLGRYAHENHRRLTERMLATLQGMRVIRAFGQETVSHRAYEAASLESRRTLFAMDRLLALVNPAMELGYLAILVGVIVIAGRLGEPFSVTLAVVALLYRLQPQVRELESNLLTIAQLEAPMARVARMIDRSDKRYRPPGRLAFTRLERDVTFENVTLRFAGGAVSALSNASFRIPAGRTTVLFGPSGSGKTTVVNLLLRLYEPDAGRILVDGVPLDDYRPETWLCQVAACGQDVDLIEGTVIDNIRMAAPGAARAEVEAAAAAAGVAEMTSLLPDGYDSWIGQQGANLSGGQRQRVGIARALLRDPQLLIFDEATTALDEGLARRVHEAVDRLSTGRTRVIVTHRLDRAAGADHVVCLREGVVLGEGHPSALAAQLQALSAQEAPDGQSRDRVGETT